MTGPKNDPMDTTPLVSVIMVFLDAERFIEEAIESVLTQTCTNWELLLVDDGSKDLRIAFDFDGVLADDASERGQDWRATKAGTYIACRHLA